MIFLETPTLTILDNYMCFIGQKVQIFLDTLLIKNVFEVGVMDGGGGVHHTLILLYLVKISAKSSHCACYILSDLNKFSHGMFDIFIYVKGMYVLFKRYTINIRFIT